ncbi:hypothetical protein M2267_001039 [Ensifer sp. KUDG1]|uniref:hypothetical protein n=1 Tax=Ensifer sp. KUDG1 TaxID=3373919 RepID=UPI003D22063D
MHKIKVLFSWPDYYGKAMKWCPGCDDYETGRIARKLLDMAIRKRYPQFPDLTYEIDGSDEDRIEVILASIEDAMLFKLTHGGES